MNYKCFSVLIPVYHQTDPKHLEQALNSVFSQSISPSEVILVVDRTQSVPELNAVLNRWDTDRDQITIEPVGVEHSLGFALQRGVDKSSHELIFRMDADDICKSGRFASQLSTLKNNPSIDVLGSYIEEFDSDPNEPHAIKKVPVETEEVEKTSRYRCPLNHPSVVFKKSSVLDVGGYRDIDMIEDYDLWMRLLHADYKIENIPKVLVSVRANSELYARRGGLDYLKAEFDFQKKLFQRSQITFKQFIVNIVVRTPIRLSPNFVRKYMYKNLLRS